MKKIIELTPNEHLKIEFLIETDYVLYNDYGNNRTYAVMIRGEGGESSTHLASFNIGDDYKDFLQESLQKFMDKIGGITARVNIISLEFLESEYHARSFKLNQEKLMSFLKTLNNLQQPKKYILAEDFINKKYIF